MLLQETGEKRSDSVIPFAIILKPTAPVGASPFFTVPSSENISAVQEKGDSQDCTALVV